MKRFIFDKFTAAGAEILDCHRMTVAYVDLATEAEALAFAESRNVIHEIRTRQAEELRQAEARAQAGFGRGKRFAA